MAEIKIATDANFEELVLKTRLDLLRLWPKEA
jgi:hypothetical protein